MHHVIMQAHDGQQLHALLEYLAVFGVTRVVYPPQEYQSLRAGDDKQLNTGRSLYDTARLLPLGDDGGFAETFLAARQRSRHISDT